MKNDLILSFEGRKKMANQGKGCGKNWIWILNCWNLMKLGSQGEERGNNLNLNLKGWKWVELGLKVRGWGKNWIWI